MVIAWSKNYLGLTFENDEVQISLFSTEWYCFVYLLIKWFYFGSFMRNTITASYKNVLEPITSRKFFLLCHDRDK